MPFLRPSVRVTVTYKVATGLPGVRCLKIDPNRSTAILNVSDLLFGQVCKEKERSRWSICGWECGFIARRGRWVEVEIRSSNPPSTVDRG